MKKSPLFDLQSGEAPQTDRNYWHADVDWERVRYYRGGYLMVNIIPNPSTLFLRHTGNIKQGDIIMVHGCVSFIGIIRAKTMYVVADRIDAADFTGYDIQAASDAVINDLKLTKYEGPFESCFCDTVCLQCHEFPAGGVPQLNYHNYGYSIGPLVQDDQKQLTDFLESCAGCHNITIEDSGKYFYLKHGRHGYPYLPFDLDVDSKETRDSRAWRVSRYLQYIREGSVIAVTGSDGIRFISEATGNPLVFASNDTALYRLYGIREVDPENDKETFEEFLPLMKAGRDIIIIPSRSVIHPHQLEREMPGSRPSGTVGYLDRWGIMWLKKLMSLGVTRIAEKRRQTPGLSHQEDHALKLYLRAIEKSGIALKFVPEHLKTADLCLKAVKAHGESIEWAPRKFKTPDLYLEAVQQTGLALKFVPENFKTVELCMLAVKARGKSLEWVPQELKIPVFGSIAASVYENFKTTELCILAVIAYGESLERMPQELQIAALGSLAALDSSNGAAFKFIPEHLKAAGLCEIAVEKDGRNLEWAPEKLKTPELCLKAVKGNGGALEFVPEQLKTLDLCYIAVQNRRTAYDFVPAKLQIEVEIKTLRQEGIGPVR